MELHEVRSADGTKIGAWKTGAGDPLVLVHGATADHTRWRPVLDQLAAVYTVYAMDRRGRGASADAAEYALERESEDVAALVDSLDAPAHLLGHSYGGLCAMEGALLTTNLR